MAIRAETGFSLADQLFNADTLKRLTSAVKSAYPEFRAQRYKRRALIAFPQLELKARISWLSVALDEELPNEFDRAIAILHKALPEPLDSTRQDDDFGQFIWAVFGDYVARHGCTTSHLATALTFLGELTKRFSAEFAIRPFLKEHPEQTLTQIRQWAGADHYHLRRLASEGIRPYLPWAQRVVLPAKTIVSVLELLHADNTRFVTRSVANTLNDISRQDPDLVLTTLARWQKQGKQNPAELAWMTRHALRTLSKQGHAHALSHLGYPPEPRLTIESFDCDSTVGVGQSLTCTVRLRADQDLRLKLALGVGFRKANGKLAEKIFALKELSLAKTEAVSLHKKISFKPMTTRTLYPGHHTITVIANGKAMARADFDLVI